MTLISILPTAPHPTMGGGGRKGDLWQEKGGENLVTRRRVMARVEIETDYTLREAKGIIDEWLSDRFNVIQVQLNVIKPKSKKGRK